MTTQNEMVKKDARIRLAWADAVVASKKAELALAMLESARFWLSV